MHRISIRRGRRFRSLLAATTVAATVAVPATAAAADYVVTLEPSSSTTCAESIGSVTADYGVTASRTYTSSFCGFSTSTSPRRAQLIASDRRVASVASDGGIAIR